MKRNLLCCLAIVASSAALSASAFAANVHFDEPSLDRWMYPFNSSAGSRPAGSTFGAVGDDGVGGEFDDRDAQILFGFNLAGAGVATGQGSTNYQISSVTLRVTVNSGNQFFYDPTYDTRATYLTNGDPNHVADSDAGRPLELFGAGFRNGYTGLSYSGSTTTPLFGEDASFPNFDSNENARNVYALGYDGANAPRDVSNSIKNGFESNPFAIGQTSAVAPGAFVPLDAEFEFTLNLADPNVLAYVRNALNSGSLALVLTSLHAAEQEVGTGFPSFYFKENILHDPEFGDFFAAQLDIQYEIIPEPSGIGLLALAGLAGTLIRKRRKS